MNWGSLLIQGITVDFPIGEFLLSLFFGLSWKWERCSGYRRETLNPDAHIPYLQPPFSPKDDHQKFAHVLVSVSFLVYDTCDLTGARPELQVNGNSLSFFILSSLSVKSVQCWWRLPRPFCATVKVKWARVAAVSCSCHCLTGSHEAHFLSCV